VIEDDRRDMALRVMFETLSQVPPTPAQIEGYRMSLADMPIEALERGIRVALRKSRSLPRPVEIREMAGRGPDVRPYHLPYVGESRAERKRIAASWEPVRRALAAASESDANDPGAALSRASGGQER
jgi:hypothetical protein